MTRFYHTINYSFSQLKDNESKLLDAMKEEFEAAVIAEVSLRLTKELQPLQSMLFVASEALDKVIRNHEFGLEVRMLASDARARINKIEKDAKK